MLFMVAVSMAVKLLELLSSPMLRMSLSLSLSLWSVSLLTTIQLQKYFIHKSQGRVVVQA